MFDRKRSKLFKKRFYSYDYIYIYYDFVKFTYFVDCILVCWWLAMDSMPMIRISFLPSASP